MKLPMVLLVLLAACRASAPAPAVPDRGAFAFLAEGDTTLTEEYTRTEEGLSGELWILSPERAAEPVVARYRVRYGPEGRAEHAELSLWRRGLSPDSAPTRAWSVQLAATGEVVEVESDGATRSVRAGENVAPLFGPSVAMLEDVLRRAQALRGGRGTVRIPVFHIAAAGRVDTAVVTWLGPDSVSLVLGDVPMRYRIGPGGRLLGGRLEEEGLETVRLR